MKNALLILLLAALPGAAQPRFESTPYWSDEFNRDGAPDPTRWNYAVGGDGWGNQELQYYTDDQRANARVEGGHLIVEAHKQQPQSGAQGPAAAPYTSARLISKGKGDFLYGRFEIRARLPRGRGTWPAIWTLASQQSYGKDYWPDNGEIDIMEHVGFDPGRIHASIHSKAFNHIQKTQRTAAVSVPDAQDSFHNYILEWTPERIRTWVDDQAVLDFPKPAGGWQEWPFDRPQHLLLNLAVGGFWGGEKGVDESIWPQRMEVDYVRVYRYLDRVAGGLAAPSSHTTVRRVPYTAVHTRGAYLSPGITPQNF